MALLGTLSFDTRLNAQAVKDAETIKKQVLNKLGKGINVAIKPTFMKSDLKKSLQTQLNTIKPKVKVDIIVDQATASQAVQQALAKAGLMNNMTAGQLRAQRAAEIQQRMQLALARAHREAATAADRHSKSLLTLNSHFGNGITLGGKFSSTVASIYSVYTLKNFVQSMIEIGGEFQKQRIALENMLGSVEKANTLYSQMKGLAVESPFTFMDLMTYTKQLKAFQIPYNELFETTKRLGDISAGLGVDMNRLILAYGQVRSAAVLRGQEVRQFTEAGIPLLDALSKKFSELEGRVVSVGDVFDKISKRQVSFDMVKQVLWDLTNEGGQFYNMQEKLTESLSGKLDKLKDSYQIMVAEMAQGNNAVLGTMLDIFTKLVSYGDKVVGVLGTLTGAYLAYKGAMLAANAIAKVSAAIEGVQLLTSRVNAIRTIRGLTSATWGQVAAQKALNVVTSANPIALVITVLTTAIGLYVTFKDVLDDTAESTDKLNRKFEETDAEARSEEAAINLLFGKLRKAKEGTEEYYNVKNQIIGQYGHYLKGLSQEISTLKDVEGAYKAVAKAARDAAMARGKEAALSEAYSDHGKNYARNMANLQEALLSVADEKTVAVYMDRVKAELRDFGTLTISLQRRINDLFNPKERSLFGHNAYRPKVPQYIQGLINNEKFLKQNIKQADQLFGITDVVEEKAKRNELWWQKASQYAADFKQFAPNLDEDFKTYADRVGKELNSVEAEIQKRTPGAPDYASLVLERDALKDIYTEALKMNLGGLSKFKSKSSGSDEKLKQWQEDFSELQAFYQEYVKWAKSIGEEQALKKLYETGLWGNLFNDDGTPKYDMRSWDKAVQDFRKQNGVVGGTTERDKFVFKTKKAEIDFQYDINQKDLDHAFDELNEYISKQSSKFNLYKSLLEKTGNKEFAKAAFEDGKIWDDAARQFEAKLKELSGESEIDYTMTDAAAKKHFEGVRGGYELWKKIVEIISGNYVDALNNGADAISNILTTEEKIKKIDREIVELENKRNDTADQAAIKSLNAQISSKNKERKNLINQQFEESSDYVRFFTAILSMSVDEAENVAVRIRDGLVKQMQDGTINANKFMKEIKNIDSQLRKIRKNNIFEAFKSGGFEGVAELKLDIANDELLDKTIKLEEAEKNLEKARERVTDATTDEERQDAKIEAANAEFNYDLAKQQYNTANKNQQAAQKNLKSTISFGTAMSAIAMYIQAVLTMLDEARKAAASYGENLDAGIGESKTATGIFGIMTGINSGISKLQQGDIAGAISSTIFGSIAEINRLHDADAAERQKIAEDRKRQIERLTNILEKGLERTLGSIYEIKTDKDTLTYFYNYLGRVSPWEENKLGKQYMYDKWNKLGHYDFVSNTETGKAFIEAIKSQSYYDAQYALLLRQRDQLEDQLEAEKDKKDRDSQQVEDYKEQISEIEDQIAHFAEDMAKSLYDIDIKSWASELGDALFEAWQKGESGAEAFKKKASELMADLAKNIAVTKLVETAMQPVLDEVVSEMKRTKGKLDEQSVNAISEQMAIIGETLPDAFNNLMDGLNEGIKKAGLTDMKELASDSSSSMSNGIKSITEETADLLASYVNGIRADVSVIRATQAIYLPTLSTDVHTMSVLSQTQVTLQQQIAANTLRNADAADKIYEIMHRIDTGVTRVKMG